MQQASYGPDDIDAIVPMGLGIPGIDQAERDALRSALGERADTLPMVLLTPTTGNCCAGHGAVQLAVATRCLETQQLPSGAASLRSVLVLTASQGGQNTATILSRGTDV